MILYAVFFYVRYAVSYRDLEEIVAERGVQVNHATLNRWAVKYSAGIAKTAQTRKQQTARSWRMDETYARWYRSRPHDPKAAVSIKSHISVRTIRQLSSLNLISYSSNHAHENFATEPSI